MHNKIISLEVFLMAKEKASPIKKTLLYLLVVTENFINLNKSHTAENREKL
jgi:hypothetical protein